MVTKEYVTPYIVLTATKKVSPINIICLFAYNYNTYMLQNLQ